MILLDTCVLTAYFNRSHLHNVAVTNQIVQFFQENQSPVLAPQCLYEFYVVATRPQTANGIGLSPKDAFSTIAQAENLFPVLPDTVDLFPKWKKLLQQFHITGKTAHDTRLVAWMLIHRVNQLYTLNVAYFQRYHSLIGLI